MGEMVVYSAIAVRGVYSGWNGGVQCEYSGWNVQWAEWWCTGRVQREECIGAGLEVYMSLIHIYETTRQAEFSYAVF